MAEKIELVVYRHKERKDLYLTRNWSYCGGSETTEFYRVTKDIGEAIASVLFGMRKNINESFENWMQHFLDKNGKTKLVVKIMDSKEFEFDRYKGTATKEITLRVTDFERVVLTEKGE